MQDLLKVAAQAQRLATITAPARAARHSGRKRSMQVGQPRASAPRPRARRTAASSSTSSADPGDDGPGEPPPPRLALALAPPPRAIYSYAGLTADQRGAQVEAVAR
jgi:hypothetical protein